jgi:ABC-type Zn2+ transport system substrate-binding protein/surface adhesin
MATVELGSLAQHYEDEEVSTILKALKRNDVEFTPNDADTVSVAKNLDDDVVADFLDRLDAHEASADMYLPVEFDGVVKAGNYRIGSAPHLVTILEEMKEELLAEDEDEDEDYDEDEDEDDDYEDEDDDDDDDESSRSIGLKDEQIRHLWMVLFKAAAAAAAGGTVLFVKV